MTDEIYRCNGCKKIDCNGRHEFRVNEHWYPEEKLGDIIMDMNDIDEERYICEETEKPETMTLVYSSEWERD